LVKTLPPPPCLASHTSVSFSVLTPQQFDNFFLVPHLLRCFLWFVFTPFTFPQLSSYLLFSPPPFFFSFHRSESAPSTFTRLTLCPPTKTKTSFTVCYTPPFFPHVVSRHICWNSFTFRLLFSSSEPQSPFFVFPNIPGFPE